MWWFVFLGTTVHVLLLSSVFDVYFSSPILHGMSPHKAKGLPLARRAVIFIADGLRAESLYGPDMQTNTPYLNSIIEEKGSWGISHTRVPTESRPGHIAILAGFNEDPSAITRGWKYNPVDFDSVINQSTNAWCWGSPDIVYMFNRDHLPHIHLYAYDAYMQDFSGKNSSTLLDTWVFEKVDQFISTQLEYCDTFCDGGNVVLLHLLGLDTAGHSIKPTSDDYITNLKIVDKGIQKTVKKLESLFPVDDTAYIFTADHGMTNWGSHGDGSAHESEVPFIAWGAGIVHNTTRQDINQTDIAPMISLLIGNYIPINSLGIIPLNYLKASIAQKADIMQANVLQLSEQFLRKHQVIKESMISWLFHSFPEIPTEEIFYQQLSLLNSSINKKSYKLSVNISYNLIDLFQNGLKYYHNYFQNILLLFITSGFIGWITYVFISITDMGTPDFYYCKWRKKYKISCDNVIYYGVVGFFGCISVLLLANSLPLQYYLYCFFPMLTWSCVLRNYEQGLINISFLGTLHWKELLTSGALYFLGIQLLILTFFRSGFLTLVFLFFAYYAYTMKKNGTPALLWIVGHAVLGICPLFLSLQTSFSVIYQSIAGVLWLVYGCKVRSRLIPPSDRLIITYQIFFLTSAFGNSLWVHVTFSYDDGLLWFNQVLSWFLLSTALLFPLIVSSNLEIRVLSTVIALVTPYTLMAVGYESVFLFFVAQHMINWLSVEHAKSRGSYPYARPLAIYYTNLALVGFTNQETVQRCFYLLSFIMLSYFGVGNTASISSFDPMWVRCFVTVFSPYTMAALILFKLIIPFLVVMCAFRGIMVITKAQIRNTFLIILFFCDLMVIQLLYFVKNEGSWLEIGVSLSRFVVVNFTTVVLLVLYEIAYGLTTGNLLMCPAVTATRRSINRLFTTDYE